MLDELQIENFRKLGYLNLGPFFDKDRLDAIGREYDRLVTFEDQVLGNEEQGVYPYRAMLNFRSKVFRECIRYPGFLEIAIQLLGRDIRFWWDQGINKAPGSGSRIEWHQDNGYQRGRTQEFITLWLALDDSDLENGGLEVIPRSFRDGLVDHVWEDVHAVVPEGKIDQTKAVALNASAGDVLLFSSLLVHRTVGNHSEKRNRRAWVVQYCRGDQYNEETGEIYDNRPWVVRDGKMIEHPWAERKFILNEDRA